MAHFDRFDILAAWNLYLQHHWAGQGCPMYARHCKVFGRMHANGRQLFDATDASVSDLSENALEIYTNLCANAGTLERPKHPIANNHDCYPGGDNTLFKMWAGSGYEPTQVYVWADSFEDAFEVLVEWLDENAPGCLVSHEEARGALAEYVAEHGCDDKDGFGDDGELCEQVEQANDWTVIGHTTLSTGSHIRSDEWGGDEVEIDSDEYNTVLLAGTGAAQEHFQALGRAAAVGKCEKMLKAYRSEISLRDDTTAFNARMRHAALVTLLCKGVVS